LINNTYDSIDFLIYTEEQIFVQILNFRKLQALGSFIRQYLQLKICAFQHPQTIYLYTTLSDLIFAMHIDNGIC
jgi:hypothetical protein